MFVDVDTIKILKDYLNLLKKERKNKMFFELKGKGTFGVKFSRQGTTTLAEWMEVEIDDAGGRFIHTGIYGIASLHYNDRFVKKIGRVVALTNLLKTLSDHNTDYGLVLHKEDRKIIWEVYFRSHKK